MRQPPHICNVFYNRDCQPGGCNVQQIANQTEILISCVHGLQYGRLPDIDCQQALKWVIHFIGDIAQPLHASERDRGGNEFCVQFNGTMSNMHSVWDRLIFYFMVGRPDGFSQTHIDPFFAKLVERTREDAFLVPRDKWLMASDPSKAIYWAEQWAKDSNALNCDFVYGRYINGSDLYLENKYARDALAVLELQTAKAAWRLGGWLNAIAELHLHSQNWLCASDQAVMAGSEAT